MTATFLFSDQDDFNSISDRRAARERLERLAWAMDSAIRVPGTNFTLGADAMLGLVPPEAPAGAATNTLRNTSSPAPEGVGLEVCCPATS